MLESPFLSGLSLAGLFLFLAIGLVWTRRIFMRCLAMAQAASTREAAVRCAQLARRTGIPLTIIHSHVHKVEGRACSCTLGAMVGTVVRATDVVLVGDWSNGQITIVCPGTSAVGIGGLCQRLSHRFSTQGYVVSFGTASYPEDGYAFEALCETARHRAEACLRHGALEADHSEWQQADELHAREDGQDVARQRGGQLA